MPTFDFACAACGSRFSVFVPVSQKNSVVCVSCKSPDVNQVFTAFNFVSPSKAGAGSGSGKSCSRKSCSCCSGC